MKLQEFIVHALKEVEGTQLKGGIISFDLAVYPADTNGTIQVATPNQTVDGLTRIRFDVSTTPPANPKEEKE